MRRGMRQWAPRLLAGAVGLSALLLAAGLLGRLALPRPLLEPMAAARITLQSPAAGTRAELTEPGLVALVAQELGRASFARREAAEPPERYLLRVAVYDAREDMKKELYVESSGRVWQEGHVWRCAGEVLDLRYLQTLAEKYGAVVLPGVEAQAVEKLILEDGRSGTRAEVTDREAIRQVVENLGAVEFERLEYLPPISGYGLALTFCGGEGETLCALSLDGPLLARHRGFRLQSRRGKVDMSYLEGLCRLYGA